jgi:hypothetical protein
MCQTSHHKMDGGWRIYGGGNDSAQRNFGRSLGLGRNSVHQGLQGRGLRVN